MQSNPFIFHSVLNPIVGPISGELAVVAQPDSLPGEQLPPAKQKLTEEQRLTKEAELFDSDLDMLPNILQTKTSDGHLVTFSML